MQARRKEGSKFSEIDIFVNVYVRPEDELTESFHGRPILQESASQLPLDMLIESVDPLKDAGFHVLTETLDQTFSRRPGTYCRGIGNAKWWENGASSSTQSKGEVTTLMQEVDGLRSELASYKCQMSLLVQALSSFGIRLLGFSAQPPLEPLHPKHTQQSGPSNSNPVTNPTPFQQQDYQAPPNDLPIDYASFFS